MRLQYLVAFICAVLFFNTSDGQKKDQLPRFQKHYVRDRETASTIASNFNVKLKDFLMLNNFPDDVKLKPGQLVLIRQLKDGEKVADEKPYTAPKQTEQASSSADAEDETRSTTEMPAEAKKTTAAPVETKEEPAASPKPETTIEMLTGPNGVKYQLSGGGFHIVQKGQTFYRIALIYHLTIEQLKALNNMTTTDIKVGQELRISK